MYRRVAIVGAGIIGLAIAHKILRKFPKTKVFVFEKEESVGNHQSGRNSGVLHCGLYYQPGSLKAKLAVEGIREMKSFCRIYDIPHEICGKIVVATDELEIKTLDNLAERGHKNGLKGLKFLTHLELKKREPYVVAKKVLLVPEEGIVDYKAVMRQLESLILQDGGTINLKSNIIQVENHKDEKVILTTYSSQESFDLLINCSGLYADINFRKFTRKKRPLRIVPFRGEYLMFKENFKHLVNHLIYPVPDIKFPFLGVHFTRLISGEREVGPNAVLALKREGYSKNQISVTETFDIFSYTGFNKFILKNFTFVVKEFSSSLFLSDFVAKAQKLIPDVNENMFIKGTSGVRAQAMSSSGDLIMDFQIFREGNQIHVLNAPSPGATASLAIADYIIENYLN